MTPQVGSTCAFTYIAKFALLNGIYKVQAETTFQNAIASGIDFVANLYEPAGLSQTDFNADYKNYLNDCVVTLQSVKDSSLVFNVPESLFLTIPDSTIKEYYSLILVVALGAQENPQIVYPLIDQVKDLIQSSIGTTDPVKILTNPQNKAYLTDADYQALVAARLQNAKSLMPLSVQLKQEQDKNAILAAKNAELEKLVIQLSS